MAATLVSFVVEWLLTVPAEFAALGIVGAAFLAVSPLVLE